MFKIVIFFFSDAVKSLKDSTEKTSALEEMVNSFSEQKVQSVSEVEKLTKELQKSSEVSLQCQKSLDELTKKFDNLETEKQVQDRYLILLIDFRISTSKKFKNMFLFDNVRSFP